MLHFIPEKTRALNRAFVYLKTKPLDALAKKDQKTLTDGVKLGEEIDRHFMALKAAFPTLVPQILDADIGELTSPVPTDLLNSYESGFEQNVAISLYQSSVRLSVLLKSFFDRRTELFTKSKNFISIYINGFVDNLPWGEIDRPDTWGMAIQEDRTEASGGPPLAKRSRGEVRYWVCTYCDFKRDSKETHARLMNAFEKHYHTDHTDIGIASLGIGPAPVLVNAPSVPFVPCSSVQPPSLVLGQENVTARDGGNDGQLDIAEFEFPELNLGILQNYGIISWIPEYDYDNV